MTMYHIFLSLIWRQTCSQTNDSNTSRATAQLYIHSTIIRRTRGKKRTRNVNCFIYFHMLTSSSSLFRVNTYIYILINIEDFFLIHSIWIQSRVLIVVHNRVLCLGRIWIINLSHLIISFQYAKSICSFIIIGIYTWDKDACLCAFVTI
jgi:hypothetical protein